METDQDRTALHKASEYCGIQAEFWDIFGHHHIASSSTRGAIVRALGFRAGHLEADLADRELARWSRLVDSCVVAREGRFTLRLPEGLQHETLTVRIQFEDGDTQTASVPLENWPVVGRTEVGGQAFVEKYYTSSIDFPAGYHDLVFSVPGLPPTQTRLIVTPSRAYLPPFLENGHKSGGIAIALYGLRSARNWGCGDFRDLRDFCEWAAAEAHVSFVALNPLHALHNREPYNTSPYLPNSIFYQNLIYLNVESIDEFSHSSEAQELFHAPETRKELTELRDSKTVQYERVQTSN